MRYSLIRKMDISNGDGVGISLFVQGCHFHCPGCFNQETWDFTGGKEWTEDIENQFLHLAEKPYVRRISILGGEPLADENVETVYRLLQKCKCKFPEKQIWIFTGYTWESIIKGKSEKSLVRMMTVATADVLADGQFQYEKQDVNHKKVLWVGSTNQRVIDVKKSMTQNAIVLYAGERTES